MAGVRSAFRGVFRAGAVLPLAGALAGCATHRVPTAPPAVDARPEATTLSREVATLLADTPGQSGFHLIEYGREALLARGALADAAERSIDCQYYIYDPDQSGAFLTERLLAAADRGVRVRMLLDDFNLGSDANAALIDAHPNIEVRLFNPVQIRARWLRLPQYLLQFNRLVRRMHNKVFAVDGCLALLGGRNIGDNYFDLDEDGNFRDFDLLCAGPVAADANTVFERYWNSPFAVPMERLAGRNRGATNELAAMTARIDGHLRRRPGYPEEYRAAATAWREHLPDAWIRAPGEVVWEPPEKIKGASMETALVVVRLARELAAVTNSVAIESGYFVPRRGGTRNLTRLAERGVKVSIVTTALQATDEPLVFSAYSRYRKELLRGGVELYEYRRDADATESQRGWRRADSSATSLHSKVLLLDERRSWIGSFNLDPRSAALNTEIAVLVDSPEFAAILRHYLDESMDPARSFAVHLGRDGLIWTGRLEGKDRQWHHDPGASWWQRTRAFLYGHIPGLEGQL